MAVLVESLIDMGSRNSNSTAEIILPSADIKEDIAFYTKTLGFRMEMIYPADNPAVVVLSGHGMRLRLDSTSDEPAGKLRISCDNPSEFTDGEKNLTAPNGTVIEIASSNPPMETPKTEHMFFVRRLLDNQPWVIGRAGMNYRDLIPNRLGGAIIASHIRIPTGGPVPDMVHYHTVGFQLIYCYKGWVRLVYEDQGPEFILRAGDCVIQPPEIRHRVLEAAPDGLEVIEIGVPAEHVTTIDHDMELPTGRFLPERDFGGQKFIWHKSNEATWTEWDEKTFDVRDSGISEASAHVASVKVLRVNEKSGVEDNGNISATSMWMSHNSDIHFTFVLEGSATLSAMGQEDQKLSAGEAFVLPPDTKNKLSNCSMDLELLQVSLPAGFVTTIHAE